jgi:hypothetical protein
MGSSSSSAAGEASMNIEAGGEKVVDGELAEDGCEKHHRGGLLHTPQ